MIRLAALAAIALTLAAPASGATGGPSRAGIAHWRATIFQSAHLNAWWRGYLGGPAALKNCRQDTSGAATIYNCQVVDVSTVLALAHLMKYAPCRYAYIIRQVGGTHTLQRLFTYCG